MNEALLTFEFSLVRASELVEEVPEGRLSGPVLEPVTPDPLDEIANAGHQHVLLTP